MSKHDKQPIAQDHPDVKRMADKWERCRDACAGSDAVKAANVKYLPRLGSHSGDVANDGRYQAYLKRALWYNASRRTRVGLAGAVTSKPPQTKFSTDRIAELARQPLRLLKQVVNEQLEVGRGLALVSMKDNALSPTLSLWRAEAIVNWRWVESDGEDFLVMLVLEDEEEAPDRDAYSHTRVKVRHSYRLVQDLAAVQAEAAAEDEDDDEAAASAEPNPNPDALEQAPGPQPEYRVSYEKWVLSDDDEEWTRAVGPKELTARGGKPLERIPAMVFSSEDAGEPELRDPLLLDIVDVNLSHYMNSADLEHGRHWTALPTAYASGFPTKDGQGNDIVFTVGAEEAWITEETNASAGYLEFSGAGLGHLQTGMTEKQEMMAVLGSRLLEQPKSSVEAAETLKTRLSGEKSVLAGVAKSASAVATWAVRELARFDNPAYKAPNDDSNDFIMLDEDFTDKSLTPGQLQAYTMAMQSGAMSYEVYFGLLKGAGIQPTDRTIEQEKKAIEDGPPQPPAPPDPFQGGGTGKPPVGAAA